MDAIEKIIAGHRDVREREDILQKLIKMVDHDVFFWDNALKVAAFFDREVYRHLDIEENVLFPVMRKVIPPTDVENLLSTFEEEHIPIREKIRQFGTIAREHTHHPSKSTREHVVKLSREIIEVLVPHAQKEDDLLFNLVHRFFKPEDYHEVAERYGKYLAV